jgi:hypothetical protein
MAEKIWVLCHEHCRPKTALPFGFGNQALISSHRKLRSSKAAVVKIAENSGCDPVRHDRERRAQANHSSSVEICLY